jgi:predicted amidohydrolase
VAERRNRLRAGFFQFAPVFGQKEENLEKVSLAVSDAAFDLLVLPEFFATGYYFVSHDEVERLSEKVPEGPTTQYLADISRQKNCYIIAGLPEKDGLQVFNSAVFTGPEGFIGVYRKTHLFFEEKLYFTPGDSGFLVWDTEVGRIGIMICFDWFFPESMRTLALRGAEIIGHPANLVLPYCPSAMPIRCLENRVFAVTANRTGQEERRKGMPLKFIGQSLIASPAGEVREKAPEDEQVLMIAEIDSAEARNKALNERNDLFKDRRPEMYDARP